MRETASEFNMTPDINRQAAVTDEGTEVSFAHGVLVDSTSNAANNRIPEVNPASRSRNNHSLSRVNSSMK